MLIRSIIFLILMYSSAVNAIPVFVNGGFEDPGTTGSAPTGWDVFSPGSIGFLTTDCRTAPPESAAAYEGSCSMRLNSTGAPRDVGVSQAVSGFIIGNEYTVTTQVANYFPLSFPGDGADSIEFEIRALLAGGTEAVSASSNFLGLGDSVDLWSELSYTFVADAETITFEFAAQLNSDRAFIIDNAVITPIPAAVWLFGSALAGLGWMRRRQTA